MRVRQEVLNVLLAELLQEQGLVAAPEQVLKWADGSLKLPDVLVDFQGLRLIIEAEFGETKSAQTRAYKKAQQRIDQVTAHM